MSLKARILDEIASSGSMSVARFMELALYDPELGYYTAGPRRAGTDFFTGPTLHPFFGWAIARGVAPLLKQLERPTLVEAGVGSGELARDVLLALAEEEPATFERLRIVLVDRSEPGLQRARHALGSAGIDLADVEAATELPRTIEGVLLSNELLDAHPVHLCEMGPSGPRELVVAADKERLDLVPGELTSADVASIAAVRLSGAPVGTRTEAPIAALHWYARAARWLKRGAIVTIDYGDTSDALVKAHPRGTLHAYNDGLRTEEFLANPGLADITYLVPFDLVRQEGERAGLATVEYAPQGEVLERLGIREVAKRGTPLDVVAIKKLLDPNGAGGTFKVLVQGRGIEPARPWR